MAVSSPASPREKPPASALWLGDPDERVSCPYDNNHRIPKSSLEKHKVSCRLRKLEYCKAEEAEMYDSSFFYEKVKIPTILMDKNLQFHIIKQASATDSGSYCPERGCTVEWCFRNNDQAAFCKERYNTVLLVTANLNYRSQTLRKTCLPRSEETCLEGAYSALFVEVPQNHKRSICDLTQADRLAIYNYVLTETKNQRSRSQLTENDSDLFVDLAAKVNQVDDGQKGPKSHLEILAEMRDYKRRRQSYRAKNVHITKKSYTEVIRDVIGVHMEELATHWQEESKNLKGCEDGRLSFSAKPSGRKDEHGSASIDSRQSCGSSKDVLHSRCRKDPSRSPDKQKKSQEKERNGESQRKRERDEDKYRSHKRRK